MNVKLNRTIRHSQCLCGFADTFWHFVCIVVMGFKTLMEEFVMAIISRGFSGPRSAADVGYRARAIPH